MRNAESTVKAKTNSRQKKENAWNMETNVDKAFAHNVETDQYNL